MKEENPDAFPSTRIENTPIGDLEVKQRGMTLRDYFAGQAIEGVVSDLKFKSWKSQFKADPGMESQESYENRINDCANTAYQLADAMLKQRTK